MRTFLETTLISYDNINITFFVIIKMVFLIMLTIVLLRLLKKFFKFQSKKKNLEYGDIYSIYQIIKYILSTIVIIMLLDMLGVNTTILLTSSAALLVGVGLGLQNIFKDFLSGIILLFGKVIRINDIVQVDNEIGKILEINLRATKILTRDNTNLLIPNSKFVEENVVNWTLDENNIRLKIDVGVAYGSDVELVKRLLLETASNHADVLNQPSPFVRFSNFGNNSLDFQLFFWSDNIFGMENTKSDIRYKIDQSFRNHNITIPFPQLTLWMQNEKNS
ncbi:MAG: mechanosensitive ion channel [Bacteroidales bacterium]|nr:mechanosensitive ion channel [Bacteroidales bacterium]